GAAARPRGGGKRRIPDDAAFRGGERTWARVGRVGRAALWARRLWAPGPVTDWPYFLALLFVDLCGVEERLGDEAQLVGRIVEALELPVKAALVSIVTGRICRAGLLHLDPHHVLIAAGVEFADQLHVA